VAKRIQAACAVSERRLIEQIEANCFALLAHLKHFAELATCLNMQQPIPAAATIATEGGYAAALAPPIELLNDDTEPIESEFVDFTRRGEVNPTGPERPLRTVCEPNFETPTEDAASALTTNLLQSPLNSCHVVSRTHAHSIGVGCGALPSKHALPIERTESILRDPRQDTFTRLAPAAVPPCAASPQPRSNARPPADPDFARADSRDNNAAPPLRANVHDRDATLLHKGRSADTLDSARRKPEKRATL
jgi:hypothetical protein